MAKLKTKGFIRGIGTILDLYPPKGKYSIKRAAQRSKSDYEAIGRDWKVVGKTLSEVMDKSSND